MSISETIAPEVDLNTPWHTMNSSAVAEAFDVVPEHGLHDNEVARRHETYGPNRLAEAPRRARWKVFLDQFANFLILILIAAAVVAFLVSGEVKTPIVIGIVVVFNAILGYVQEGKAEKSLDALRSMLVLRVRVRRESQIVEVDAEQLVPGDIVLIEAGDRIPADGILFVAHRLEVEEAALTGESHPSEKSTRHSPSPETPLGDRHSAVFMNSTVSRGRGEFIVTGTGMTTEIGKIAGLLRETEVEKSPLQVQLDKLGHALAALAGVVTLLVFIIGLIRGVPIDELFLTAVSLAVASVPEGLPAVVAVTLAIGTHKMAMQNAIIKRLSSVETLGCTSVICSDKTGTLTVNQMTAVELSYGNRNYEISGEGYSTTGNIELSGGGQMPDLKPVALAAALCNDATVTNGELVGDPTEGALIVLAEKIGIDTDELRNEMTRLDEVPFDSEHKFMASFHEATNAQGEPIIRLYAKGAPDVLIDRCTKSVDEGERIVTLDKDVKAVLRKVNSQYGKRGLRVLGLARRDLPADALSGDPDLFAYVNDLTLVALVGIVDPPRSEAKLAINECNMAGIEVKMITGDHAVTAAAIGSELGLEGEAVSGTELNEMPEDELVNRIDDIAVFARVAPEHKIRIVKALRSEGHVVAMTGDGVNDAPALKAADIGVAMGITGTEVTKEAATMVLTDDNFATIVRAVKQGRTIYDNIVKFVRYQLSTTIGFSITFLISSAFALAVSPFQPIQILWVNILMDGPPAMAIGVDPPADDIMQRKPRPLTERILSRRRFAVLAFFGAIMAAATLGVMVTAPDYERGADTLAGTTAGTMAFTTFVFAQFFKTFNVKNERRTAFRKDTFRNRTLWAAIAVSAVLQVLAVITPAGRALFDTVGLTGQQWAICIAAASAVLWLEELRKLGLRLFAKA